MSFKLGHVVQLVGSTGRIERAIVSCQAIKMFDYSLGIRSTFDVEQGEC